MTSKLPQVAKLEQEAQRQKQAPAIASHSYLERRAVRGGGGSHHAQEVRFFFFSRARNTIVASGSLVADKAKCCASSWVRSATNFFLELVKLMWRPENQTRR